MVQEPDFIWLKKELVSGNTSLLLYQVPINAIKNKDNLVSNIIKMRDSVGALYIHGKEPNTDMITEEAYSPYFFKIKLDGKLTYEMKGTWELRNFMSGPLLITQYLTKKTIGVVFGRLCYSPSKEKRDLMHQLESIIKSVSVLKMNCKLASFNLNF
jgi:isopenicillin N synthase-like dioxygenase